MIAGLKVHDPRLRSVPPSWNAGNVPQTPISFPPANPPVQIQKVMLSQRSLDPSPRLAGSEIWDTTSAPSAKPRFRKRDLDERRAKVRPSVILAMRRIYVP